MAVDRLLIDIGTGGTLSVALWRSGEYPKQINGTPDRLEWPLDAEALEGLRWYLEDYLRAPYAVYADRGEQIAANLPRWGEAAFRALFGNGPIRDALHVLKGRANRIELVLQAEEPGWLGLPWELMREPGRPAPLVLEGLSVDRSLPLAKLGQRFEIPGGRLRVLMVIARPSGASDVGFQMIARPLMRCLTAVRGKVELVVLRPPTLDRLEHVLTEAARQGNPFHIVHFDGHGTFATKTPPGGGWGPLTYAGAGEGMLVFEKPTGGTDYVSAGRVAQALADARVPVVVLNACQSGAIGSAVEAAVATRLLQGGASSVVAMAYSVYARAAAEFMAAFYERLFAGETVSQALTAGRAQLARNNERPSHKGELPLQDWVVPVHYSRGETSFPELRTERPSDLPAFNRSLKQLHDRDAVDVSDPLAAEAGLFVGRDALFYHLETASRRQKVILLHGPGGTGKTELAKAFGRWWRDSGGVDLPEWVIWHSFEPGVATFNLDGLLSAVCHRLRGPQYVLTEESQRYPLVVNELRTRRMLLILDNFETVASMPDPTLATPPLDDAERQRLHDFLEALQSGQSTVLITSRAQETWLGETVHRIEVGGLADDDAKDYANELLASYPASHARRAVPAYAQLMEWLDGHPLSMRLILPRLQTTDARTLLDELQGIAPLTETGDTRTTSLAASITYSFNHLDPATADALTALSLFHNVTDADVLTDFSAQPEVPPQFADLDEQSWADILNSASEVGLLTPLGAGMYRIHPALPTFLTTRWRTKHSGAFDSQQASAQQALAAAYVGLSGWLLNQIESDDAQLAIALIRQQRNTMGAMLTYLLGSKQWAQVRFLVEPLNRFWDLAGLTNEANHWTDRILQALQRHGQELPDLNSDIGGLWLIVVGAQASRQLGTAELGAAQGTYKYILKMLLRQQPESSEQQMRLAVTQHQLGLVTQLRGDLDGAESWYRQSLRIAEQLGDRPDVASTYCQLGMVAQLRGDLDGAESWYRQSLRIDEQLGNRPGIASSYGQMGLLAEQRQDMRQALEWTIRCVRVFDQFPHPMTGPAPVHLHRLTNSVGIAETERVWLAIIGQPIPDDVRHFLTEPLA